MGIVKVHEAKQLANIVLYTKNLRINFQWAANRSFRSVQTINS